MPQLVFTAENTQPIRTMPAHEHGCWEYILYMNSSGVLNTHDRTIAFRPGTIVKLPPHTVHWESSDRGYLNYAILFDDPHRREGLSAVDTQVDHPSFRIAAVLHAVFHAQEYRVDPVCQSLLDAFLLSVQEGPAGAPADDAIAALARRMREQFQDPRFRIRPLFDEAGISVDHGRRLFKASIGASPARYLMDLRIRHAQQLLRVGLSVKEAAYRSGFVDQLYFSRIFKRNAGVRPSEYAASAKGKAKRPIRFVKQSGLDQRD